MSADPTTIPSNGRVAVVFAEDMYECLELHYPRLRLIEAGYTVHVVAPPGNISVLNKTAVEAPVPGAPHKPRLFKSKDGYIASTTTDLANIDPKTVNVVVVPGGFCCDRLRRSAEICQFVRDCWFGTASGASADVAVFNNKDKSKTTEDIANPGAVVGFICHAAWLPISAKIVDNMTGTCFLAVKDDVINAGMQYVSDKRCVVDGRMVTAQVPDDCPYFMKQILEIDQRRAAAAAALAK